MQASSGRTTTPQLLALLTSGGLTGEWVLDPGRSSVRLHNSSLAGLARVNGEFHGISGHGTVAPDGAASGTLTVAAASVDTGNTRRDNHLRSADFFDSANHPDITFTADSIRAHDDGAAVTGALTVRGRTRPLSFTAAAAVQDDGTIRLDAEVGIDRADFGLTWNRLGLVSMGNTLTVRAVFARQ
jgi:polyisoprenoid-binding protein YceI